MLSKIAREQVSLHLCSATATLLRLLTIGTVYLRSFELFTCLPGRLRKVDGLGLLGRAVEFWVFGVRFFVRHRILFRGDRKHIIAFSHSFLC